MIDFNVIWDKLLQRAIESQASDIHIAIGQPAVFRREGSLLRDDYVADTWFMSKLVQTYLNAGQQRQLQECHSYDCGTSYLGWRWRLHFYYQKQGLAAAIRLIPRQVPSFNDISSPVALRRLAGQKSGLILITGRTGSGKTTTLAAFLQELNHKQSKHIVTLEDPIEYIHTPDQCFISQREYGRDFSSFHAGLRDALRENADAVMVGEIRDTATMRMAIEAASTGILVLGTLHTRNAIDTALRIESMFSADEQAYIRYALASVLLGVFSQQLLPSLKGGQVAATEVLLASQAVKSVIRHRQYNQLESIMLGGSSIGMQRMRDALGQLYAKNEIDQQFLNDE